MFTSAANNREFFTRVTARPGTMLAVALLIIAGCAVGLTQLVKDTSVKAFIPEGHESLLTDRKADELFGLSDTIAVAILTTDAQTVFTPETLNLIAEVTDAISMLDNIRPDRVASLATESAIHGADGAIFVDPYVDPYVLDDVGAEASRARFSAMQPHHGTLVSTDERGAVIMAELVDTSAADTTYERILELATSYERPGIEIHVAGPGATSGYLSSYIDRDARKLQPLVFVVVLIFIYFAFRRAAALPGPLIVVLGSAAGAVGLMSWAGVPYYAITSALPVIVVAISVADAIHILSTYYQLREETPKATRHELIIRAMCAMVRPITLTTITTIAGFSGIAMTSIMPPITWFAIFASIGVAFAWLFSIFVLPNVLLLVDPGRSPAFRSWLVHRPSGTGRLLAAIGTLSPLRYRSVLAAFVAVTLAAGYGAQQLRIDRSQVENFAPGEPIRVADELINARFSGTAFLDVIVETHLPGGLLRADRMQKIVALQEYFETLPNVQKTVSIADYISELHQAIEALPPGGAPRPLPSEDDVLAETLFLYEMSGDPADLEEEIDIDNRAALVRGVLNAHYYSENRTVVEKLQQYIVDAFNEPGMTATLTGDVNVSYHWMQSLKASHFQGVACSLLLVLSASVIVFRSFAAGLVAVVPVLFTILILYACMGYLDIYLEPATSMFAAIALGVGVDFAIHLVDRLRSAVNEFGNLGQAIDKALPPVARACLFNSAALGVGFSVLLASDLPTLTRFGGLVALAAFASFAAALIFVPAMFAAEQAWFGTGFRPRNRNRVAAGLAGLAVALAVLSSDVALAAHDDGSEIARAVAERTEGNAVRRRIDMILTNRRGRSEQRTAVVYKRTDDDRRLTRITFEEPARWQGRAFLSHDYFDESISDERWMFLPARETVRTIPASQRGDSFLGTDFSYADIQSELKFDLADWDFEYRGEEQRDGQVLHRLVGTPKSARIARELGYGGFAAVIDAESWIPIHIDFSDLRGRPLKTVEVSAIERIDGIWTPRHVVASNHQTGHSSRFEFRDIDYLDALPDTLFSQRTLGRRMPGTEGGQ